MVQKYKVFFNQTPIVFTTEKNHGNVQSVPLSKDVPEAVLQILKPISDEIHYGKNGNLNVLSKNPSVTFEHFQSSFHNIEAAGGVITNSIDELLLIFRKGKWDLPKGKRDADESIEYCALREVEEETGVKGRLTTKGKVFISYHLYPDPMGWVFKKTFWFKMEADVCSFLKPQPDEGIVCTAWIERELLKPKYIAYMYPSIVEVLSYFSLLK